MKTENHHSLGERLALWNIIFLAGYALGRIVHIYNYFYDAKGREGYFIVLIFFVVIVVRQLSNISLRFNKIHQYLSGLIIAFIALTGPKIIYFTSGYNDWSGLICMLFTLLIASIIPLPQRKKYKWIVILVIFMSATLIGFLTQNIVISLVFSLAGITSLTYYYTSILRFEKWLIPLIGMSFLTALCWLLLPKVQEYESQNSYYDKVVFSQKTKLQQVDITEWKGHHWFYYDKVKYLSSVDEWMYFEPLVHPVMHLLSNPKKVLVIGGENGGAIRELTKYKNLVIDQLPFDVDILELAKHHPLFTQINQNVYKTSKVNIVRKEIFNFLANNKSIYDAIIVDMPDPLDVEVNQFYSKEFYKLCATALRPKGMISTQAGSPYFATKAFLSIDKTIQYSGMKTIPMHNQIPSLGEWGWIIAYKKEQTEDISQSVKHLDFSDIETVWLNHEALNILFSFGKKNVVEQSIKINSLKDPVTHVLYKEGDIKID